MPELQLIQFPAQLRNLHQVTQVSGNPLLNIPLAAIPSAAAVLTSVAAVPSISGEDVDLSCVRSPAVVLSIPPQPMIPREGMPMNKIGRSFCIRNGNIADSAAVQIPGFASTLQLQLALDYNELLESADFSNTEHHIGLGQD